MLNQNPKISIVTICLNAADVIESTILSVIKQTYKNIEYIIIDGGSTDGTLDIIKRYAHKIDHFISEPDSGIYAAMNKGTKLATGDWVNYLNAGDRFFSATVLEKVFKQEFDRETAVIYGDVERVLEHGSYLQKAKPLTDLSKGVCFSHQSMFVAADIAKQFPYDTTFNIAADFNFVYTLYKAKKNFLYVPICISSHASGGISDVKRIQSVTEGYKVIRMHEGFSLKRELSYLLCIFNIIISQIIKEFLPKKLSAKIILWKNN